MDKQEKNTGIPRDEIETHSEVELLPCPFCGALPDMFGAGTYAKPFMVVCNTKKCYLRNRTTTLDIWNTRASTTND